MPTGIPKSGINKGWFKKGHKRIITPQMIENYRKANLGSKNPMFGKKPWNKNKITPQKIRDKISKTKKGCPAWNKDKKLHYEVWNKGKAGYSTSLKGRTRPDLSGKNHWNWKGGKSPKNNKIRRSEKYQQWRRGVFIRDHYTCQKCGHRFIGIVAHHKKSFNKFPRLRYKINNGITLCRICHARLHKLSIPVRGNL